MLTEWEALQRVGIALLLGGILGFERDFNDKPAGLRTYALVCEGATLFMVGSIMLGQQVAAAGTTSYDPSRIASTIVQGIGFLAAGLIFVSGRRIHGLTSAAGIWVTAAIGMLVGMGFLITASVATVATVLVLSGLKVFSRRIPTLAHPRKGDPRPDANERMQEEDPSRPSIS